MKNEKEWFAEWFDTPYYHILYKDRDFKEAEAFINALAKFMNLPFQSSILDLACGKGRHALQLNQLGYRVKGVDLSSNSIEEARKKSNPTLSFDVADMRNPLSEKFDAVYNLFTSFGYFNSTNENLKVLSSISQMLHQNGKFVIDFMNSKKATEQMITEEIITKSNIAFNIQKTMESGQIIKTIKFSDKGRNFQYEERVQALMLEDFQKLINQTDLQITHVFGDYQLNSFDEVNSDRLIIVGKKP
jgi:SAM-dependent methyltransferase